MTMLNTISLRGLLIDEMTSTTSINGAVTYHGTVCVTRQSGAVDRIPIALESTKIPNLNPFDLCGRLVTISGEVRTFTRSDQAAGHRHQVVVWVHSMYRSPDGVKDDQLVNLEGVLCSPPKFRVTPLGREICELMVACNRGVKSSYIPVICWGRVAREMSTAQVGDKVEMAGRFQSRKYEKKLNFVANGEPVSVWRTAHEISANTCRVIGMQRRMRAE